MDRKELQNRIADILKFDCYGKDIIFDELPEDGLAVNTGCYAITATAAAEIADLAKITGRSCIFTIESISTPFLQIRF